MAFLWTELSKAQYNYFYSGKDYGSEALFSPINQIISGGFDMLQVINSSSSINDIKLEAGFRNVFTSLSDPHYAIDLMGGWKNFFKYEILISTQNGQWIPNYSLHLLGGGMEFARLTDFYAYYGYKYPRVFAAITSTAEHLLNEAVETGTRTWSGYGVVADIYVFNTLGMVAFSFESVQRFFSQEVQLRSWLSQTSYSVSDHSVRNVGQFYSIKWQPEITKQFSLFSYFGAGALLGAGYDYKDKTISFGAGFRTQRVEVYDEVQNLETIIAKPSAGVFLDKNNSLLASLVYTHGISYQENIRAELFPGFIKMNNKNLKLGFWMNLSFSQQSYGGVTIGWFPGVGL